MLQTESSLAKMGHTVKMVQLSALNVQVDTAVQIQVLIQLSVMLVLMLLSEVKPVWLAQQLPSA